MPNPYRYIDRSEAQAVVGEARALECETVWETDRLLCRIERDGDFGPCGSGSDDYQRLREAATAVVEIAWSLQDPTRDNPYRALGAAIIDRAASVLADVRDYQPGPWGPGPVSAA